MNDRWPPLTTLKVHPLADMFPMLSDDGLNEFAADIKQNGLLHPIVRTTDGKTIVDGRNRAEACRRAGVEPRYDDIISSDAGTRTLIVSANLQRRNLTQGQRAMALAMIYPEPTPGKRTDLSRHGIGSLDVSKQRLSLARAVLRAAPDDLAPQVLAGAITLDKAHAEVIKRQQDADSEAARLARPQTAAPDLADLVVEERMNLGEATAAAHQRAEEHRKTIEAARRAVDELISFGGVAVTILAGHELGERGLVTADHLDRLEEAMTVLRSIHEEGQRGHRLGHPVSARKA